MKKTLWAALLGPLALLASVAFVGCGGDDSASPAGAGTTLAASATPAPTLPSDVTVPAGAPEIDQNDLAFKPDKLTVKVGDKVYVKNSESAIHTFNVAGKNLSGNMKRNQVYLWTAATAGTFRVTCDYHPQMNATITVTP